MASKLSEKSMCEISYSAVEKEPGEFISLVSEPKYICKRCCMTAADKKNLCKAKKLKPGKSNSNKSAAA